MSGKRARCLRKKTRSPKKVLALCVGLCLSYAPVTAESEFLINVFAPFSKPFGEAHQIEYGTGGGLKFIYRPSKYFNIYAQGEYLNLSLPGTEPIASFDGSVGAGYHLEVSDRVSFDVNASGGAYRAGYNGRNIEGFTAGVSLVFSYKISPVISLDATASASHFAAPSSPLMMVNAGIAPGITFNINQMFNKSANVDMQLTELAPVFPALYSWYEKNSFGKVNIFNNEETAITNVTVSFYQPQYMAHPKECMTIRKIEKGQSAEVDLIAFFNEQMLELTERSDTNSFVTVSYMCLGQKRTKTFPLDVPVYGRNNMSWDDDRRAAVFVSSKDPAAMHFAKYVTSIVRGKRRFGVPVNVQYALGIFEALNQFGINYVVDPSSAFEDNVGTASIDFLQFPYQTLMYKGGDCDDLSILVCSLFEAVGIRTAFITIPGHIFMAFDSGLSAEEAKEMLRNPANYIEIDGEVWIPLEITLSDEGFYKAYKYGAREWNKAYADGTAAIYRMHDSWEIYPPISVPGAAVKFTMPTTKQVSMAFEKSVDEWSFGELMDLLRLRPARLEVAMGQEAEAQNERENESETVIKEDPFAYSSLYEVLALSGQSFAMLNTSGVKVKDRKDDDSDDSDQKPGLEPEPDEDEAEEEGADGPEIPVIAVNVLGPEELGIKVDTKALPAVAVAEPAHEEEAVLAEKTEPVEPVEPVQIAVLQNEGEQVAETVQSPDAEETVLTEQSPEDPKKIPVAPIAGGAAVAVVVTGAASGISIARKKKRIRGEK